MESLPSNGKDIIPAYRWRGEANCLIGPFACRTFAIQFSGLLFKLQDRQREHILKNYNAQVMKGERGWFIDVQPS